MEPLAQRVRPLKIEDFCGQEHLLRDGAPLKKILISGAWHSILLWGPPGVGKTSLARIMAGLSGSQLVEHSAVSCGVKDLREVIDRSKALIGAGEHRLTLFVDEIHRLSKSQQDVLLPALEEGSVKFIAATTENPSFEVNRAVLSRTLAFRLEALNSQAMKLLISRVLATYEQVASEDGYEAVISFANGDARKALNCLEACLGVGKPITRSLLEEIGFEKILGHGEHFDLASALIKSIRASHADAALYYIARLMEQGDDPMFIARRLMISASEDIGNANPQALQMAVSAAQACQMIGFPEARIILGQLATYLAASPKSNRSYEAIGKAINCVKQTGKLPVPMHLLNSVTSFNKQRGVGEGYIYPHSGDQNYRLQSFLPKDLRGEKFYTPSEMGAEKQFKLNLEALRPKGDD